MVVGAGPTLVDGCQQVLIFRVSIWESRMLSSTTAAAILADSFRRLLCSPSAAPPALCQFVGVHRADDPVLIQHLRGRRLREGPVPVGSRKRLISSNA